MSVLSHPPTLGVALLLALTTPGLAQGDPGGGFTTTEQQALTNHRLTMDNIRKTADASVKLSELEKKDPKLGDVREGEEAKTLSELVSKLDALPPVHTALAGSGLSSREFLLTLFELHMVRSAVMLKEMGGDAAQAAGKLPVSAENVQFYVAHRAEIEPLAKQMTNDEEDGE